MRRRVARGSRPWVCRCDEPPVTGSVRELNERAACCGGRSYRGPNLVGRGRTPTFEELMAELPEETKAVFGQAMALLTSAGRA